MECNILKSFSFDFKNILIDEIALEGLEGIDIDLLWRRVEKRFSCPVTEKMKRRYWTFIASSPSISFYELPQPVPHLDIKDRFKIIDEESGHLKDPDDYLDGPYEYKPVENEYGSCAEFQNRKLVDVSSLSYDEVMMMYDQKLIMVASKEERLKALAPHVSESHVAALNSVHYCLLELIGRSRENGQMTIGKTNLLKIVKDSKMLFYHRKFLKNLDLIRVTQVTQKVGDRGVKSLLLRLRRFHQSVTMSFPKVGPIRELVEHLKRKADYSDVLDEVFKKGILTQQRNKKFQKTYSTFEFSEKEIEVENSKKVKGPVKRRFIAISTKSDDESSASDEDCSEPVRKCQYKVGVSLLRQAYQNLKESGLKGLTQIELAQLLGMEFYTSRNICKMLKSKGLVKEVYEDVGRQRTGRLILVGSSLNNVNANYEEEWRKFINYRDQTMLENEDKLKREIPEQATTSSNFTRKLHFLKDSIDLSNVLTEVTKIEGLEGYDLDNISLLSTKKSLTLRQLKYANGIIKALGENLAIGGYQAVNNCVAAATGEPHMDTRALKVFLQKLLTDGLVKVYKMKWPDLDRYTTFVCAPYLTSEHPIFKDKYEEILLKVRVAKESSMTRRLHQSKGNKALSRYSIPRYSKVRKFHEYIFKLAYFNDTDDKSKLPEGFGYLHELIPGMTVEYALANVNLFGQINLTTAQVNEIINMKLKDVSPKMSQEIVYASTFRNTLRENLRVLAFFGLVQIVNQGINQSFDGVIYYVNRHAKIVNTTGVWPRQDADLKALESEYYLGSLEDVTDFWNTVFQISTNTQVAVEKREFSQIKPPVRTMTEVQLYDKGERLGDGRGPCGFDSSFYLDQTRLWRADVKRLKSNSKSIIKPVLIPKLQRKRKPRQKRPTKRVLTQERNKERRQELNELKIPIARGKRTPFLLSGTWSKEDDLIITLCKVAHTIMGPNTQPGSFKLKNLVAKEILSLKDPEKTQLACHIRAVSLDADTTWTYEKHRVLNEFKKRRNLAQKYEGQLKKIRLRFLANVTKFMNEAKLPMLEIVYILLQISKSKSYTQETPCIALNMENFHKNFTISKPPDSRPHVWYNMPNATDAESVLKENIITTVAMSFNKELPVNIAKKIYAIFKVYPEMMLRKAIEELRRSHTISAREKQCNNKMYKMNLQDLVETSYKLSAGYYRKWICKLNAEFLDSVADAFDLELPIDDVLGGAGINCFCCELHTIGLIDISTSSPPSLMGTSDSFIQEENLNVIDIEQNYKLKSGMIKVNTVTNTNKISLEHSNVEEFETEIARNANVMYPDEKDIEEKDDIVRFLKEKQEKGAIFRELQEYTKMDPETLMQRLLHLESRHNIKRVGLFDNRIVHIDYAKFWSMTLDKKTFMPAPWITLYGTLRHEIFFRWTNVIMSKIFEFPGCSIKYLTENCELISSKCVQDVCIFLMQCECVTMKVMRTPEVDLFSDEDSFDEPTAYNPYESPANIIVFPTTTALTKYASIRRKLLISKAQE